MATHLAAVAVGKGQLFEVKERQTPKPGPDELLLDVKSVALNPIDSFSRSFGFAITEYPAVVGSDIGGLVLETGTNVTGFQPGTRVTAFAPAYFVKGAPDYGALQQRVIVPATNVAPIPQDMSFSEAAKFPMAVATTWGGLETISIPRNTSYLPSDKRGILVWGASSSVGSMVVQSTKSMGFTVYATSSLKHHGYIKSLGASRVFDYQDPDIKNTITQAAKEDGLTFQYGYFATDSLQSCQNILKALKGSEMVHLASAPNLKPDAPTVEGIETKFVAASPDDKKCAEQFSFWFNHWLKEKLENREIVSSPKTQVHAGGLDGVNKGLDILKEGVSCTKLVLEI
ncbi:GroES-like protein [Whalleya microplaca]|nr:GroES-like protein [Whalleya microplaca]